MNIELTESEIKTLRFYLDKSLIDAKGLRAVGVIKGNTVTHLESIKKKINAVNK